MELRGPDGLPVAEGELGEVHVRSPYLMLGYWDDPAASEAVLKPGGWLAMGDVGRLEDGLLYLDARARDMIFVSAENVAPTEVEYRLEAHPEVLEAAVFAVDDPTTGDAVCAVVSLPESGVAVHGRPAGLVSRDAGALQGADPLAAREHTAAAHRQRQIAQASAPHPRRGRFTF